MSETLEAAPSPIVVLSTPTCSRCRIVKRHLESNGIEPLVIDVSKPGEYRTKMDAAGLSAVPQTFKLEDFDNPDNWVYGFDPDAINRLF